MSDAARETRLPETAEDFLVWPGDGRDGRYQLVDGEVQAMSPASATHGIIQIAFGSIIRHHLLGTGSLCRIIGEVAVRPKLQSQTNIRVPDLGVTCGPVKPDQIVVEDPILLVELLSPFNKAKTWSNVWAFSTIPTVREILVVHTTKIAGHLLRRVADGSWPDSPLAIEDGERLELESIGLSCPLSDLYADTHLRQA